MVNDYRLVLIDQAVFLRQFEVELHSVLHGFVDRVRNILREIGPHFIRSEMDLAFIIRNDLVQMGERARSWVQHDTWDTIAVRFEAALGAALERGGRE